MNEGRNFAVALSHADDFETGFLDELLPEMVRMGRVGRFSGQTQRGPREAEHRTAACPSGVRSFVGSVLWRSRGTRPHNSRTVPHIEPTLTTGTIGLRQHLRSWPHTPREGSTSPLFTKTSVTIVKRFIVVDMVTLPFDHSRAEGCDACLTSSFGIHHAF